MRFRVAVVAAALVVLVAFWFGGSSLSTTRVGPPEAEVVTTDPETPYDERRAQKEQRAPKGGRFTDGDQLSVSEPEPAFLEVSVLDGAWETPVDGAVVKLYEAQRFFPRLVRKRSPLNEGPTEAGGVVRFAVEPHTAYDLTVSATGYAPSQRGAILVGAEMTRVQIRMSFKRLIRGRVVDLAGKAIASSVRMERHPDTPYMEGTSVVSSGMTVSTGQGGNFSIGLTPGRYRLTASALQYEERWKDIEVGRAPSEELVFALEKRTDLIVFSGRVVDTLGIAPDKVRASLYLERRDDGRWRHRTTLAVGDGSDFRLELPPTAPVRIEIESRGYDRLGHELDLRRSLDRTFVLTPWRAFTVLVVDFRGSPVEGAEIIGDSLVDRPRGVQRENAVLRLPGTLEYYATNYPFRVYAHALNRERGVSEVKTIDEYVPEIRLTLQPGGRLRGRAVDSAGHPVKAFRVKVVEFERHSELRRIQRDFESKDGTFRLENVPEGDVRIQVTATGDSAGSAEETVKVTADRTAFVEVILRPERGGRR